MKTNKTKIDELIEILRQKRRFSLVEVEYLAERIGVRGLAKHYVAIEALTRLAKEMKDKGMDLRIEFK